MTPQTSPPGLACATWNVHRARGADGRVDPARIAAAIAATPELARADILVLTEADGERSPYPALLDHAALGAATGLWPLAPEWMRWGAESAGFLGTVVLLRAPLVLARGGVLDLPGLYPRGAVVADIAGAARPFRLVATHLSLAQALRVVQMRTLAQHLARLPPLPVLLAGDLNEWRPWGGLAFSAAVAGQRLHGPAEPTFPAARPFLPLDRILSDREGAVQGARVPDGAHLRAASDHLPLAVRYTPG